MRKILIAMFIMAMAVSAYSAQIFIMNFDAAPAVDLEDYPIGPGDFGTTASIHFPEQFYTDGYPARDYGFNNTPDGTPPDYVWPDDYTDSGNYPDIVTPTTPGFQGGNAFWTCTGDAGDPQDHIGWYIAKKGDDSFNMSGDFTAEAIFMLAKIGTSTDAVAQSEYSLHNIFGTESLNGPMGGETGAYWKFRVWPDGPIGGTGQLQLWTGVTTGGGGENDVDGPSMSINTWYHVAAVYTESTNTIELFLDGVSQGTNNPSWDNTNQNDWWVGAWPNNPANRGLAGWIDAVALSDVPLTPSSFVLPRSGYTGVPSWNLY